MLRPAGRTEQLLYLSAMAACRYWCWPFWAQNWSGRQSHLSYVMLQCRTQHPAGFLCHLEMKAAKLKGSDGVTALTAWLAPNMVEEGHNTMIIIIGRKHRVSTSLKMKWHQLGDQIDVYVSPGLVINYPVLQGIHPLQVTCYIKSYERYC